MSLASFVCEGFGPGGSEAGVILDGFAQGLTPPPGAPVARTLVLDGLNGSLSSLIHQGFSAYKGLIDPPPAGKQYTDVASVTWMGDSVLSSLSPATSIGCVLITDLVTSLGYTIVMDGDGTFVIHASGDNSTETFAVDLWRPGDMFDWGLGSPSSNSYGSWTVTVNAASSGGTGGGTGTGTGTGGGGTVVPPSLFSVNDPNAVMMIEGRTAALLPNGWFQS